MYERIYMCRVVRKKRQREVRVGVMGEKGKDMVQVARRWKNGKE
jgi:hypothetical protein